MYIKKIILDGFKSYAEKVEVDGFDPQFNAITGLNGSGKSNILDGICFVLGIQNLALVRVSNMTELVYKNGQAGINKATVTIFFDNSDPSASPKGYEESKEIVVERSVITGGKTKYTINGINANNNRVHDLFRSVSLNVNNPHFLIMQGRITKVMNMRPMEILSMVEEAAKTGMYEDKKSIALKNLEKRESKIQEINELLETHICPQMERLKEEKKECIEFNKIVREFEKLDKVSIAWDFVKTEEFVTKFSAKQRDLVDQIANLKKGMAEDETKIQEADEKLIELEKISSEESGDKLKELEDELKKQRLAETKADSKIRNLSEYLDDEFKKKTTIENNIMEEKNYMAEKQKELDIMSKKLETLKMAYEKDAATLEAAEEEFCAANSGINVNDDTDLDMLFLKASKEYEIAVSEAKSITLKLKNNESALSQREAETKSGDENYAQNKARCHKLMEEVKELKNELAKINHDEDSYQSLLTEADNARYDLQNLQHELENLLLSFPACQFDYKDPVKNFDRSCVKGPVCMNFEVKDPKDAVALETVAGGKLYNVIVDNEETGKLLLGKGNLKRRVTLIPLNKINARVIRDDVAKRAKALAGQENVSPAIDRIRCSDELMPAMQYVFGGVFICTTMDVASKVTFDPDIKTKSVALEGDVVDPSGTLSGGSLGNRGKLLKHVISVQELKRAIRDKQNQSNELQNKLKSLDNIRARFLKLDSEADLKEAEAHKFQNRIQLSNFHKKLKEIESLKEEIESQKSELAHLEEKKESLGKLVKELEIKTSKAVTEKRIEDARKQRDDASTAAASSEQQFRDVESKARSLTLQIEDVLNVLPGLEEQLKACEKRIEECQQKFEEAEENKKILSVKVAEVADLVKKQKATIKSHNNDKARLSKERDDLKRKINEAELEIKQLEHDLKFCVEKLETTKNKIQHMLDKYKWIPGQRRFFGTSGSEFDFTNFDPEEADTKLRELEEKKAKMENNVNNDANNMLKDVEIQYKTFLEKREAVISDKLAIENIIERLDEEKKLKLVKACDQVNKDFGSIFKTLLPGTDAKLVPLPEKTVLEGLELKVAFGGVWKESLSELSGGQKSLLALSLILSLLLFNPAPIYILDEVDAALDLSHTQNIGRMLKMHFKASQFIIVSLKDGMFNNANVLFKTSFVDGVSSVKRIESRQDRH